MNLTVFNYENTYKNGMISKIITRNNDGVILAEIDYVYDSRKNLVEKWGINNRRKFKNIYIYNENNQKTIDIQYLNEFVQDSIIYSYNKGLLTRIDNYKPTGHVYYKTYSKVFKYDKNNHLLSENNDRNNEELIYSNFDSMGNWQEQNLFTYKELKKKIVRTFIY